jgi:hypothetical protein
MCIKSIVAAVMAKLLYAAKQIHIIKKECLIKILMAEQKFKHSSWNWFIQIFCRHAAYLAS